jgi:hypothetical protein
MELQIMTVSILETPPSEQNPVPIPEPPASSPPLPSSEIVHPICEFEINKTPIEELAPSPLAFPVPIPEPEFEIASTMVEFQIVMVSIAEVQDS